jgi:hypothetical protein
MNKIIMMMFIAFLLTSSTAFAIIDNKITEDTYYADNDPTGSYGDSSLLVMASFYGGVKNYVYIKIDISEIALLPYQTIGYANLCVDVYTNTCNNSNPSFTIHNVTNQTWIEEIIGNTNAPEYYNTLSNGQINNTEGSYACFDVTELMRYYALNGFKNASFVINTTAGPCVSTTYILMGSKELSGGEYIEYLDYSVINNYSESYLTGNAISYKICNGDVLEKYLFWKEDGIYKNITLPNYCENGCDNITMSCNPPEYQQYMFNGGILLLFIIIFIIIFVRRRR